MSRFWHVHLSRWTMWDWFEWRGLCADDSYSCFGFIFKALDANLSLSFVPFFTVILSNSCQVIQFHPPKWCSWAINSDRPHSLSPCGTDDVLRAVEGGRGSPNLPSVSAKQKQLPFQMAELQFNVDHRVTWTTYSISKLNWQPVVLFSCQMSTILVFVCTREC